MSLSKKVTLIVVVLAIIYTIFRLTTGASGNAFSISWFQSIGDKKVETESTMSIPMYGNNARLYPYKYKGRDCHAVATSEGVGIHCFKLGGK